MSALASELLRRPPSLRELVSVLGNADDYAWFAGLVRRLFPGEAEDVLSAPDARERVVRFAELFGERHFPLYAPFIDFWADSEGEEPPWSWLRNGIPYDLMGFGYEGVHEMWDGYREGISALALLARPADIYYDGPDGIRVAWLESASSRIPQETLTRIPEGGIPLDVLTGALRGTEFEAAARACSWMWAETGNFFLDFTYEDGGYNGFSDPWDDDLIRLATQEWRRADPFIDSVCALAGWLEEDLPGRFAQLLDFVLDRLPKQEKEKEATDDKRHGRDPVVPAGRCESAQGPAQAAA